MATRRMFSKKITSSSEFLMMSPSAQNLYFHLGMHADDDGFCEVFTIMRMTESKPDDLNALHSRGFIYVIDSKICIVRDWHTNNQLRIDRYEQSKHFDIQNYKEIYLVVMADKIAKISLYKALLKSGIPNGNQMVPQYSIGKYSNYSENSKNEFSETLKNTGENNEEEEAWSSVPVDDNGDPLPEKKPKVSKVKVAVSLQNCFSDLCLRHLGVRPISDSKGYYSVLYGLNKGKLSEKQILDLFDEWFTLGQPDEEAVQITRALSPNQINKYKIRNAR